jgi:hypothetical protein
VRLWDATTGQDIGVLTPPGPSADEIALSPDGQLLAVGGAGGIQVWETATCQEVVRWKGHRGRVQSLLFAPDGKTLVSVGQDTTALVWDVAGRLEARDGPPAAKELDALWDDLGAADAAKAWRAVRALAAFPEASAPFLKGRVKAAEPADPRRLGRLIADLDAEDFAEREKATHELTEQGRQAVPALRAALAAGPSAEARQRIEALLAKSVTPNGEPLRALRAVCALEWMGTAEAKEALRAVAGGAPAAAPTEAAAAALGRLPKRPAAAP